MLTAFVGLRRFPALLTSGADLHAACLDNYEVSMVEALHDMRNIITTIFEFLPKIIKDPQLKKEVSDFCKANIGKLLRLLDKWFALDCRPIPRSSALVI